MLSILQLTIIIVIVTIIIIIIQEYLEGAPESRIDLVFILTHLPVLRKVTTEPPWALVLSELKCLEVRGKRRDQSA